VVVHHSAAGSGVEVTPLVCRSGPWGACESPNRCRIHRFEIKAARYADRSAGPARRAGGTSGADPPDTQRSMFCQAAEPPVSSQIFLKTAPATPGRPTDVHSSIGRAAIHILASSNDVNSGAD